jgi:outer membrane lipoprotein carrier protein LolA
MTGPRERSASVYRRQFALGATALFASRRARGDIDPTGLIARIGRARSTLRTLQGPFQQTRTIGLLKADVRSSGTFALVRPDRLRWDLAPPDEVTFWVSPEGLAYKTAHGSGRLPATAAAVGGALDDLRTVLGGDLAKLRERWDLSVVRDEASGTELEAIPRAGTVVRLQNLRFSLTRDSGQPTRVVLTEGPRDHTLIEFGALIVNARIEEARMIPPP